MFPQHKNTDSCLKKIDGTGPTPECLNNTVGLFFESLLNNVERVSGECRDRVDSPSLLDTVERAFSQCSDHLESPRRRYLSENLDEIIEIQRARNAKAVQFSATDTLINGDGCVETTEVDRDKRDMFRAAYDSLRQRILGRSRVPTKSSVVDEAYKYCRTGTPFPTKVDPDLPGFNDDDDDDGDDDGGGFISDDDSIENIVLSDEDADDELFRRGRHKTREFLCTRSGSRMEDDFYLNDESETEEDAEQGADAIVDMFHQMRASSVVPEKEDNPSSHINHSDELQASYNTMCMNDNATMVRQLPGSRYMGHSVNDHASRVDSRQPPDSVYLGNTVNDHASRVDSRQPPDSVYLGNTVNDHASHMDSRQPPDSVYLGNTVNDHASHMDSRQPSDNMYLGKTTNDTAPYMDGLMQQQGNVYLGKTTNDYIPNIDMGLPPDTMYLGKTANDFIPQRDSPIGGACEEDSVRISGQKDEQMYKCVASGTIEVCTPNMSGANKANINTTGLETGVKEEYIINTGQFDDTSVTKDAKDSRHKDKKKKKKQKKEKSEKNKRKEMKGRHEMPNMLTGRAFYTGSVLPRIGQTPEPNEIQERVYDQVNTQQNAASSNVTKDTHENEGIHVNRSVNSPKALIYDVQEVGKSAAAKYIDSDTKILNILIDKINQDSDVKFVPYVKKEEDPTVAIMSKTRSLTVAKFRAQFNRDCTLLPKIGDNTAKDELGCMMPFEEVKIEIKEKKSTHSRSFIDNMERLRREKLEEHIHRIEETQRRAVSIFGHASNHQMGVNTGIERCHGSHELNAAVPVNPYADIKPEYLSMFAPKPPKADKPANTRHGRKYKRANKQDQEVLRQKIAQQEFYTPHAPEQNTSYIRKML